MICLTSSCGDGSRRHPARGALLPFFGPGGNVSPHSTPRPLVIQATGRTVLVVDDQDELRAMLVRVLAGDGYRVLEARDGFEALEVLETEPEVSLVVDDLLMPRMDGLELARHLAGRSNIQILFMSACPDQVSELPFAFLPKPFSPATLCAAVQRLLAPSQMQA